MDVGKDKKERRRQETEVADAISSRVLFLQTNQGDRLTQLLMGARLYGNSRLLGVSGIGPGAVRMPNSPGAVKERVTDNIVQAIIDTVVAQVGENKPRPYFLTSGGTFKQQRKAKRLNQFTEGIFYENEAYKLGGAAQRDAEVFGDGLIHIFERNGRVTWERVLSAEFWIDEAEGLYGKPREGYWVRPIDRFVLAEVFGADNAELRRVIMNAPRYTMPSYGSGADQSDMVLVRECWHLRSGPDAKDGKHTISIDGHLLCPVEEWPHDFFPFARFKSMTRPLGYWSQGASERLQSKQLEINKLLWLIQRSMHMAATYKVLIQDGSKIVKEHINNEVGAIITWKGTKPEWFVPQVVPPEYYMHYKDIRASAFEQEGVSMQVATGEKPAGLNSGEAQRVYRDTVAQRMKTRERLNEEAYLEAARISIAIARDIAKREGHYEVEAPERRAMKPVRMTARELDDSDWNLQCFPTSSLPKDPAGRLATIQEYIQAGFMSPRQGRRALDFPDLEAVESLANAEEDLLTKLLDAICDEGEYDPPEPTDDLQLAKELVVEYINRGRMQGLDDDRLELLRTWSAQVDALMAQAAAAVMPPPGAMPMGPEGGAQAVPEAAPVSQLLPNAPGAVAA